ncbi:MAG: sugar nucleotide-binding protein, partial [Candidatus Thermoplasmatota archaeon]|nr:sugar nucleotide-binding protein [Candidatus Thermoplasmatota archaeon]
MPTLLVIGGSGLLGSKLAVAGKGDYDVAATHRSVIPRLEDVQLVKMQKERREDSLELLRDVDPDFIVDTAAFHNVDRCEEERELAWQVNAASTGSLASLAKEMG